MNENPGGSPNPLNPNPDVEPDTSNNPQDINPEQFEPEEQMGGTDGNSQSGTDYLSADDAQKTELDPLARATEGLTDSTNVDPTMRPMEKVPIEESTTPPKKKKTGLFVGIAIAAVLLICGGIVAAVMIMNANNGDAVSQAIKKIAEGNAPANAAINGTIDIVPKSSSSPIKGFKIAVDSKAASKSMLNSTEIEVTATFQEGEDVSFKVNEVYAANGDLYFKLDGLTDAIRDYSYLSTVTMNDDFTEEYDSNCIEDENGEMNCETDAVEMDCTSDSDEDCAAGIEEPIVAEQDNATLEMIESLSGLTSMLDGEWLRIPMEQIGQLTTAVGANNGVACMANFVSEANKNNNSISSAYSKNAFITSTTEGVTVASKSGTPVYKVTIDTNKLEGFVNGVQDLEFVKDFSTCMGGSSSTINTDALINQLGELPDLYAEIDNDYNFSRIYFVVDSSSDYTLTTDFGFSYPENINVAEPTEYKDFSEFMQEIMLNMYQMEETQTIDATN